MEVPSSSPDVKKKKKRKSIYLSEKKEQNIVCKCIIQTHDIWFLQNKKQDVNSNGTEVLQSCTKK